MSIQENAAGLRGRPRSSRTRPPRRRHQARGHHHQGQRRVDRRRVDRAGLVQDQGPGRHDGRAHGGQSQDRQGARGRARARGDRGARSSDSTDDRPRRRQDRRDPALHLHRGRARPAGARRCEKLDAEGVQGIVLDLRGNGGGLLPEAVLDLERLHRGRPDRLHARPRRAGDASTRRWAARWTPRRRSWCWSTAARASAAEILTGALRDRGRAVKVVGEKTFGKGVFQEVEPLPNGGSLEHHRRRLLPAEWREHPTTGIKPTSRRVTSRETEKDEALPSAVNELLSS